ncbi:DsbA family oxidoreductase [Protaetiibacter sp. SSC-01]|nr:DsbA family oxidoreductase [Protaetiibacter sp. SSC-01]
MVRGSPALTLIVPEPLKIDIWSDIACPWCFIGKRRFEAGAAEAGVPVEIEYHSFELSPDTPVDFEGSEVEFLAHHKGIPEATAKQMIDRVTGIAASVGLHYDYDALQHTNTVKAHQLLHYAKLRGRQLEMKERLLSAYFQEGRHVGRIEDLADLAAELGFDRDDVIRSLEADEHLADVHEDQAVARDFGIQGVPFFVIDRKYGVSGAQESATFAEVLRQVAAEKADAGVAS